MPLLALEYVELEEGQFPPRLGRERHSHGERGPDGKRRLYYFFPEDYPELFHHKRVCEQQGRVTLVEAYEIINGRQ